MPERQNLQSPGRLDEAVIEIVMNACEMEATDAGQCDVRGARTDVGFLATNGATYWHHIGTTRMSESPADGVVDRECRVHGVGNLSVAGSSVFCRATFSPPTMTIVAFALRLADTLDRRLRSR